MYLMDTGSKNLFQFVIRRTTVYTGQGSIEILPEILKNFGCKNVMVFSDKGLKGAGVLDKVTQLFKNKESNINLKCIYDFIQPEGLFTDVYACLKLVKENNIDGLVAVGGGSVLDVAKAVKWLMYNKLDSLEATYAEKLSLSQKWPIAQPMNIPHVAIPTTAGTGAESSTTAALTDDFTHRKVSLLNPFLGADIALLDPEMTVSLPPKLTAGTGIDAFSHALESYFSPKANPLSDANAKEAMQLVSKYLPIAVADGNNIEAREKMLIASALGIAAFGYTSMSRASVHSAVMPFEVWYEKPHGVAIPALLPAVMECIPEWYTFRCKEFADLMGIGRAYKTDEDAHKDVVKWIREFIKSIGVEDKFEDLKLSEEEIANLVDGIGKRVVSGYKIEADIAEKIVRLATK